MHVSECWIETSKRRVRVAIDGELRDLAPPLHVRVEPRALRVLAPAGAEAPKAGAESPKRGAA